MQITLSLAKKTLLGAGLGVFAAALVLFGTRVLMPDLFARFEAETLDSRYLVKVKQQMAARKGGVIEDIVIVDIDQRSLDKLGLYAQWPRSTHARMIDYLHREGAAVIAFDILFLERDENGKQDSALVASVARAGNVVNALAFSDANPEAFLHPMPLAPAPFAAQRFTLNFPPQTPLTFPQEDRFSGKFFELYNHSAKLGFVNFLDGAEDAIRRMPLFLKFAGQIYPAFALAVVLQRHGLSTQDVRILPAREVWLGRAGQTRSRIPVDARGQMLVNYSGGFQAFRYVSYVDVLEGKLDAGYLKNKIVLIGTSAPGLYDLRVVPFQNNFPGVEIHANMIHGMLQQDFIEEESTTSSLLLLLILAVLTGVVALLLSPWASLAVTFSIAVSYIALTFWAFVFRSVWMAEVEPLLALALALLFGMVYRYLSEEREKNLIYGMFGNYLSDSLVSAILRKPAMLKLGGERKFATAFFSDIKDFTEISERLTPDELVAQLNEYLSSMSEIVLKYGGYLDKYVGDAIVAGFGIPLDWEDHAERACFTALEMQEGLVTLRNKWREEKRPLLEARIGLNTGHMIAGNIGGKSRSDYTMIGDAVNLASRLEGVNKMYSTSIIISEDTFELSKNKIIARELDAVRVKGKSRPVRIFELIARRDQGVTTTQAAIIKYFARGLEYYRLQDWRNAILQFRRVLDLKKEDGPAIEFLRRCEVFMQSPRPPNWDGVFEMPGK
ncbi:MAG: adenylate/guanylate cyclase domain-containing protein [candidate division KSB1 bacterium]